MLSFGKILLIVLILAAAWAAVTIYKRAQRQHELRERGEAGARPEVAHVQTVACRVCGTYVPANTASPCGRSDCPWSGRTA